MVSRDLSRGYSVELLCISCDTINTKCDIEKSTTQVSVPAMAPGSICVLFVSKVCVNCSCSYTV